MRLEHWLYTVRLRLRSLFRSAQADQELDDELRDHLERKTAEYVAKGMAPEEARRRARLDLGGVEKVKEECRDARRVNWIQDLIQDLRYGLRMLRKSSGFAATAIFTLALGIGANTAIFSILDAAILKPLPVKDPHSLLIVEWINPTFPEGVGNINGDFHRISAGRFQGSSISANLYRKLAQEQMVFTALVGIADPNSVAIMVDGHPAEQVSLQYVSGNFFQGLNVLPVVGRPFLGQEDRAGQEPVLIVSYRFWTERLARDQNLLKHKVRINDVPARIVGVAPPGFFGLQAGQWTDVYTPLSMRVAFSPTTRDKVARGEDDRDWWVRQVGRLKPSISKADATAQIAGQFRAVAAQHLNVDASKVPELITLLGRRGFDSLNARDASALWILMLLVGVLLLIVCANVANLLLSRSVARQRESAVRLALGATRGRMFRQHLAESGLLGFLGGAAGLALGYVLSQSVHLLFESGRDASSMFNLRLDARILGFTASLSILTALFFGSVPALQAAGAELNDALKSQARSVMGRRLQLPALLVSTQIALCLTALVAAGLLGRSLKNLKWTDVGFDRENLAYASINPAQAGYPAERLWPYVDRVRDEIARMPGVLQVSTVGHRPMSSGGELSRVSIPGRSLRIDKGVVAPEQAATVNWIGEGFFETLRIPMLAGRTIDRRDIRADGEAVVVDERFAKHFFPNENPLGRRFGFNPNDNVRYEIVGVVQDSRYNSLRDEQAPAVYEPFSPDPRGAIHFVIRASVDSQRLEEAARQVIASVDPTVPLTQFRTQNELIDRLLSTERLLAVMSGAFGLVALTLAAVGIGGVLAYAVARRTNEIGIRMALGAAPGDVTRMVLRDSISMAVLGILAGLPGAYAIGKVLRATLFHLQPLDPWTAFLSFFVLIVVALLAGWLPAQRAVRIDPMVALRYD